MVKKYHNVESLRSCGIVSIVGERLVLDAKKRTLTLKVTQKANSHHLNTLDLIPIIEKQRI